MGQFSYESLDRIEEMLNGMRYGELDMEDVADILLQVVKELREVKRTHATNYRQEG